MEITSSRPAVAALAVLLLLAAAPARADDLEAALLKQSKTIMTALRDLGYRNVGVLKFHVKKGAEKTTDSAGTLNMRVADRLEVALVLANDFQHSVGITRGASAVAAGIKGANHMTEEGRLKLFEGRYPLAWGNKEVAPDAFLTGLVEVDAGLQKMTISIVIFDRKANKLAQIVPLFTASLHATALVEAGESFLLRGLFDDGQVQKAEAKAVEEAARVRQSRKGDDHPLRDREAPVGLEVRYDGKSVPFEFRDGKAFVAEPKEGQKVVFVLRRKAGGKERYGVVLKVNGENTLYRQRQPDVECSMWVFDAGDPPGAVRGFKTAAKEAEEFTVRSREESKQREVYYGADVGMISFVVFREKRAGAKPKLVTDEEEDLAAVYHAAQPAERLDSLELLKQRLRENGKAAQTRGLIEPGKKIAAVTEKVAFDPDPTPVLSAAITYYRP
jgi:hypothetical protein